MTREAAHVEVARAVTPELEEAVQRLLPQLSSSRPPDQAELEEIVCSRGTRLLVARSEGMIQGILTLVLFRTPTGVRAWIEDVVVDAHCRGKGLGEALTQTALAEAARHGAKTVDLSSRPSRLAANRLYRRVGFKLRETNLYRYEVVPPHPPVDAR